jgi:hypothetical protein
MKKEPFYPDNEPEDEFREGVSEREAWLEQMLRSDEIPSLPASFAATVARKAVRRMMIRQHLAEFLTYAAVVVIPLLMLMTIIYIADRESWQEWRNWIATGRNMLAGGGVVLLFMLFADRVMLPWLFYCRQHGNSGGQP